MKSSSSLLPCLLLLSLFSISSWITTASATTDAQYGSFTKFVQCLTRSDKNSDITKLILSKSHSSFSSVYDNRIQNSRFNVSYAPKPLLIVAPTTPAQVQATVKCARNFRLHLRIRSGGHDYEGVSYVSTTSQSPFLMLDLHNFKNISVDAAAKTAWVQPGATLGEFYYRIAQKSSTLGFPAGSCPTVGVGGHISGGGYGFLMRKYGLAADQVIDALMVDAKGRILDRASMGEEVFWAIRGGGGNTFGVIINLKVNLVEVPKIVTVFTVGRTYQQKAAELLDRWQYVANKFPGEVFMMFRVVDPGTGNTTRALEFLTLYLGRRDNLLALMNERFPELNLKKEDCSEMSWIRSILYFQGVVNAPLEVLLNTSTTYGYAMRSTFKAKSDYVKEYVPFSVIKELLKRFDQVKIPLLLGAPYGAKMDEISESTTPYSHRAGNLYHLEYLVQWTELGAEADQWNVNWTRKIYDYMTPYVSKNPRAAYINYRDLDIGTNDPSGRTSYKRASIWGKKYYGDNFDRLVRAKTAIDPSDFFRNEQSIPPLRSGA